MPLLRILGVLEKELAARGLKLATASPRRMTLEVAVDGLEDIWRLLKEKGEFTHLSTITGRDTGQGIELLYHFARHGLVLTVKTKVSTDWQHPKVPTITGIFPGAVLYEREVHDLLGVNFTGHPDLRRLVLPDDWPQGVYPLRKDWQYNRKEGVIR